MTKSKPQKSVRGKTVKGWAIVSEILGETEVQSVSLERGRLSEMYKGVPSLKKVMRLKEVPIYFTLPTK